MIYTTGTIAGSTNTITGTGTTWTAAGSLIRIGCTVIAFTDPVQVFQITAIGSATSLAVTPAANPAIAAGTRYAILLSDSLSVDGLAQDIAETFGMYQRYMGGFADVMNGTGNVTITINGTQVTVPGMQSLAKKGANSDITSLNGLVTALSVAQGGTGAKDAAGARQNLGFVTDTAGATLLPVAFGGTGAKDAAGARSNLELKNSATRDVGVIAGTVAAGDDPRLNTVDGKTGGVIKGGAMVTPTSGDTAGPRSFIGAGSLDLYASSLPNIALYTGNAATFTSRFIEASAGTVAFQAGSGIARLRVEGGYVCRAGLTGVSQNNCFNFNYSGGTQLYIDQTLIGTVNTTAVSDRALKKDITYMDVTDNAEAYTQIMKWRPATYKFKARGELIPESDTKLGIIANDLIDISKECVSGRGLDETYDGENPYDAYSLNHDAMLMKLTMALQHQAGLVKKLEDEIQALKSGS